MIGRRRNTIDPLILSLVIDVMEVPQHLDGRQVTTCVIYDALAPIFDEIFKKLQGLVNLAPLTRFLVHEARVNCWHDLIELLAVQRLNSPGKDP